MSLNNKDFQTLKRICEYCDRIEQTIIRFGESYAAFLVDSDYEDSVSMKLMQIGEFAKKLSDEYVESTVDIVDWKAIIGMRNLFAHTYGSMDAELIWNTAVEDIPYLKQFCFGEIEETSEDNGMQMQM